MQVVLPLLQNEVVATGWVSEQDFLTGFALVQAMPGPLFNFAAYLGTPSTNCCFRSFIEFVALLSAVPSNQRWAAANGAIGLLLVGLSCRCRSAASAGKSTASLQSASLHHDRERPR